MKLGHNMTKSSVMFINMFKVVNKIRFSKPKSLFSGEVAGLEPEATPKGNFGKSIAAGHRPEPLTTSQTGPAGFRANDLQKNYFKNKPKEQIYLKRMLQLNDVNGKV